MLPEAAQSRQGRDRRGGGALSSRPRMPRLDTWGGWPPGIARSPTSVVISHGAAFRSSSLRGEDTAVTPLRHRLSDWACGLWEPRFLQREGRRGDSRGCPEFSQRVFWDPPHRCAVTSLSGRVWRLEKPLHIQRGLSLFERPAWQESFFHAKSPEEDSSGLFVIGAKT